MNMPILPQFVSSEQSMTSLEIAELCQKRHDNVKRTIEILSGKTDKRDAVIARPHSEVVQKEVNNRIYDVEVYIFKGEQGKLDSITIVAQLCPEFTAALVKRWYELENQNAVRLPQTFAEALQLAADQARQLELAAPKVQYFDSVADRKNLLNATQVGQKFGMSAKVLNKTLEDFKVYNKAIKRSRVFQQWFIDRGFGELKQTESGHPQAMFTTIGEQWIHEQFVSERVI
ncbi:phage antirepressor KilAC domain-containing protein [Acinetobacter sp. YH12144]|uniref:phage antirepressor KilAC domain-containing protein n=1 Tax=Acinetobacter sp. YH12144 TaxID=2601128 RepID=UPI00211DB303|nr:phage antirepressor KilAC domain-containing protein [Acinetobacter sp. YH12144]